MPHAGHALANAVDQVEIIRVRAQHLGAAVVRHVDEVLGREPVIHRYDDRTPLWDRVELLEMLVRVGRDGGDAIAVADPELREGGGPPIAPLAELGIGQANVAIYDCFAPGMQLARAASEVKGRKRRLHASLPLICFQWITD